MDVPSQVTPQDFSTTREITKPDSVQHLSLCLWQKGCPSLSACTSLRTSCEATRGSFTCPWQDSTSLPQELDLRPVARPPSCTEGWYVWPRRHCHRPVATPCPVGVSLVVTCGLAVPDSPAQGLRRLYSQLAEFLSVNWNVCQITDTGEFNVLSHRKFTGLQSWVQIAPGNNSEYIFASKISMGKDQLLHMIWGILFFFLQRTLLPNN